MKFQENGALWEIAPNDLLTDLLDQVNPKLIEFAQSSQFDSVLATSFGTQEKTDTLQEVLRSGTFFDGLEIEVLPSATLQGALGAYAGATDTIYLSEELLVSSPQQASSVLLEEVGHAIDAQLNLTDSVGDEGAIFANVVQGVDFTPQELATLQAEDDTAIVTLNGQAITIEQAINTTQLQQLIEGLDEFLGEIQLYVEGANVLGNNLPFVGESLKDSSNRAFKFFEELRDPLKTALTQLQTVNNFTEADVASTITEVFHAQGVLPTDQQLQIIVNDANDLRFQTALASAYEVTHSLSNDFGLPGLGLNLNGDADIGIDYAMDFKFGVDADGFYYFTEGDNPELNLDLNIDIPNFSTEGNLADLLQIEVEDDDSNPSNLNSGFNLDIKDADSKLRFSELEDLTVDSALTGEADINLNLETSFRGDRRLPQIGTDLNIDWNLTDKAVPAVAFNNVTLGLGSFIDNFASPLLDEINVVLDPIADFIDFLTTPIDLEIIEFDLLDIIELYVPEFDRTLLDSISNIVKLANGIDTSSSSTINLGGFDLGNIDVTEPDANLSNFNNFSDSHSVDQIFSQLEDNSQLKESIDASNSENFVEGLEFNLLTDPTQVFRLLLGQNADLFTYTPPDLEFEVKYEEFSPIVGPLGVSVEAPFNTNLQLELGFDTYGLLEEEANFFEGFYVGDNSRLTFLAEIIGSLEANVGLAEVGGGAFLRGALNFNLDEDVRFSEIQKFVNQPEEIFSASGLIEAGLAAYAKLGPLVKRYDSPTIELVKWGSGEIPADLGLELDPGIDLGKINGESLELYIGNKSNLRQPSSIQESKNEYLAFIQYDSFTVARFAALDAQDENNLSDVKLDYSERFPTEEIAVIQGNAGDGNDVIELDGINQAVSSDLSGGLGNDILIGSFGKDTFRGGEGDDRLEGRDNQDHLFGEAGNDELYGNFGMDTLEGGSGFDHLYGGPGDDELLGGAGVDILVGGENADILNGGENQDIVSYETASTGIVLNLATGEQTGDAIGDTFIDVEQFEGSPFGDTLTGDDQANILDGGDGNDIINGGDGNDLLIAGFGDDVIDGGEGTDRLVIDYSTLPTAAVAWSGNNTLITIANAYGIGEPFQIGKDLYYDANSASSAIGGGEFSISADGTTLAWLGADTFGSGAHLYTLDNVDDSGNLTPIYSPNIGLSYSSYEPSLSPVVSRKALSDDGNQFVINTGSLRPSENGSEIYVIDTTDASSRSIYQSPDFNVGTPSISGDGSTITWTEDSSYLSGDDNVYTINSDRTNLQQITDDDNSYGEPVLNEDGSIITWYGLYSNRGIYIGDQNGNIQRVSQPPRNSRHPVLTNDATKLLIASNIESRVIVGLNTARPANIDFKKAYYPFISPDGDQVTYRRDLDVDNDNRIDRSEVVVVNLEEELNADGGKTINVSSPLVIESYPVNSGPVPVLSSHVDIGTRYPSFDLATGSGEIATWGPGRVRFSNIESFELIGTIYGDELFGGNQDDILSGTSGADTLVGGLGNDTYYLSATTTDEEETSAAVSGGSIIRDAGGDNDILNLGQATGTTLSLDGLAPDRIGFKRYHTSLLIDLNQDGLAIPEDDLLINDFFTPTGQAGPGIIETINNLAGIDIFETFKSVNDEPTVENDVAQANPYESIFIDVLSNDTDSDGDTLKISTVDPVSSEGGTIRIDDNQTPNDASDDRLVYLSPEGFTGTDNFTYHVDDSFGGTATGNVSMTVETGVVEDISGVVEDKFSSKNLQDSLGANWRIFSDGTVQEDPEPYFLASREELSPYRFTNFVPYISGLRLNNFDGNFDEWEEDAIVTEANGREVLITDNDTDDERLITRKIYVPEDQAFVRFLETVTNVGTEPFTHTLDFSGDFSFDDDDSNGNSFDIDLIETSNGDQALTPEDNWIVIDNAESLKESPLVHVMGGAEATKASTATLDRNVLSDGTLRNFGNFNFTYDLNVQPGESKTVMHFAAVDYNAELALEKAEQLSNLELDALAYMNPEELSQIVNFTKGANNEVSINAEAPTDITLSNDTIDENVPANSVVGTFSTTDPDSGESFTYNLVSGEGDNDNDLFTIDGETLSLNVSPDFEAQDSYSVRVQTEDSGGETFIETFTISVNDLNETPDDTPFPAEFNLDVDGDNQVSPLTDGLIIFRHIATNGDTSTYEDNLGSGATVPIEDIATDLNEALQETLDVDGDNQVSPLTDGLIIFRHIATNGDISTYEDNLGSGATFPIEDIASSLDSLII